MSNILLFTRKSPQVKNDVDTLAVFLQSLIAATEPSTDSMTLTMESLTATVQYLDRSYEEERVKCFINNVVMSCPGLQSLMMLTPMIDRKEMFNVACIEMHMWLHVSPHTDYYVTAHQGGLEYNFRTVHHNTAQIRMRLSAYA